MLNGTSNINKIDEKGKKIRINLFIKLLNKKS